MRRIAVAVVLVLVASASAALSGAPAMASPGPVPTSYTTLDAGVGFRCAVTAAGGVDCWGSDSEGRLGQGSEGPDIPSPVPVPGLPAGVVAVATGDGHACALVGEGSGDVWCWGSRRYGQTGTTVDNAAQYDATQITALPDMTSIAAGTYNTCGVTELGAVWCWGDDSGLQLGQGGTGTQSAAPVEVTGLPEVDQVSVGIAHVCARGVDGSLWCWGSNSYGQLGSGTVGVDRSVPAQVPGIGASVRQVAAGSEHTCVLTTSAGVRCWGRNANHQLGDGTSTDRTSPVTPTGLASGVRTLSAGLDQTCAVTTAGALRCWGINFEGEVGIGGRTKATTPQTVTGLSSGIAAVAASDYGTCALTTAGGIRCWGSMYTGELGDGTLGLRPTPSTAPGTSAIAIAVRDDAGCVVRTTGGVRCWGSNSNWGLGNGAATTSTALTAVAATGITDALDIASGIYQTCVVEADGQLRCWGYNVNGVLGTGGGDATEPVLVTGVGGDAVSVGAGERHTCAARPTGVRCWGDNGWGQLGNGSTTDSTTPVTVSNLTENVVEIAAGADHSCARIDDGSLRCWGRNSGALGNGTNSGSSTTPVAPIGIASGATSISAGEFHTCAAVSGAVKCWGANVLGQVGNPSSSSTQTSPYAVPSLTTGWVQVAAGGSTSCARSSTGRVVCWGENRTRQLGSGTTVEYTATPVEAIASGAVDVDVDLRGRTVCAVMSDATTRCWGANYNGQAGADPGWTPRTVIGGRTYAGGTPWTPFASWNALVDQQHLDLLGRAPTSSQRSSATGKLSAGTWTPGDLLASLRTDPDQTGAVDPTTRLYFAYFLRIPDKGGLEYWIRKKRGGTLLRSISDSFASSSEFTRRYGSLTNRQFVELIYQNLFARAGDPGGVDYWTRRLDTKAESRGGVMAQFSESSEYQRKMASEVTVSLMHLLIQKRQPNQAEFDAAVARLDGGAVTVATLASEVLGSTSYRNRFT